MCKRHAGQSICVGRNGPGILWRLGYGRLGEPGSEDLLLPAQQATKYSMQLKDSTISQDFTFIYIDNDDLTTEYLFSVDKLIIEGNDIYGSILNFN